MNKLDEKKIDCPYCGESIDVLIDSSIPEQNYIEDCQVCCQPITFDVTVDQEGHANVLVFNENE
jgi:transcription elongation factor Elf1